MPAVRSPRDLRGGPLLLRSLVRGLILQSISSENRPISPLSFDRVDSSDDGPPPSEGTQPTMKPKRPRISSRKTYYLVLWWMSQTPYAAIFENQVAAEAAANVRNALMVTISGRDVKVDQVQDWYRRDESGAPMPAEWRGPPRQIHTPSVVDPRTVALPPP